MKIYKVVDKIEHPRTAEIKFVNAVLHEMSQSALMDMISPALLQQIKARDPNPKFRAYVVGHEGESSGRISVDNVTWIKTVKKWFASAIRKLHDKIALGMQLFQGHSTDSNRTPIGEVVGKTLENIKDRLSVVVATYIKPEFKNLPLDVASIEADIRLREDGRGEYAADVDNVHAIALGNHKTEQPGFAGAQLVTQLFEFAEQSIKLNEGELNRMEITIDDIRKVIKSEELKPGDLFSVSDLSGDPSVKGLIDATEKRVKAEMHDHISRTEKKIEDVRGEVSKEKEELEKENKDLKAQVAKSKVDSLFAAAKEKRKFSDKQSKFIERANRKFEPTGDPEKLNEEYDKFLDEQVDEFRKISKDVFGEEVKEPDTKKDERSEEKDSATGPSEEKSEDSLDNNPFVD